MKKTIAIVAGGDSSEHDVSLRSAEGIHSFLDKERYEVYIIEIKGMTWEAHLKEPFERGPQRFQLHGRRQAYPA